ADFNTGGVVVVVVVGGGGGGKTGSRSMPNVQTPPPPPPPPPNVWLSHRRAPIGVGTGSPTVRPDLNRITCTARTLISSAGRQRHAAGYF
uniref:Uncharacterized protein n=1 Tax=Cyclopterus lumpus TaxID=8103 RepID=A0A8C3G3J8_CYCLU